jgi:ATP-dependent RNA helicase SUPV3L1/SUV3
MIAFKTLKSTSDLTVPHEWFPLTRLTKRKIIFHGGPTNSGKVNF